MELGADFEWELEAVEDAGRREAGGGSARQAVEDVVDHGGV
jgi:hypothetical protein